MLAEIDPLRSGGGLLTERLRFAGVPVEARTYPGVTHEFFGMGAVVGEAKAAEEFAIGRLRSALTQPASMALEPTRRGRGARTSQRMR